MPESENKYKGYSLVFSSNPTEEIQEVTKRPSEITFVSFNGKGTAIEVEGIDKGKNPSLKGRFNDKRGKIQGSFLVQVLDGVIKNILVPSDKLKIG